MQSGLMDVLPCLLLGRVLLDWHLMSEDFFMLSVASLRNIVIPLHNYPSFLCRLDSLTSQVHV